MKVFESTLSHLSDLNLEGVEQKLVMWQYKSWPDNGAPDDVWSLFQIIHSLKQMNPSCTLIHCNDGVGPTGTFIALAKLIDKIHCNAQKLNVFQTVLDLRKERKYMVIILSLKSL